jgi:uncharacterized protein with HEPN domain
MSRHDDEMPIRHMLESAREAVHMAEGKSRKDLDRDRMLELALTRLVEVIGEAAARISVKTRERFPSVPWPEVIGMRNRLIHGYNNVDLEILWDTVKEDLPALITELEGILPDIQR